MFGRFTLFSFLCIANTPCVLYKSIRLRTYDKIFTP